MSLLDVLQKPGEKICLGTTTYSFIKTFKDDFFALTLLVQDPQEKKWVLKISRVKIALLRPFFQIFLDWLGQREARFCRYLQDIPGIPKLGKTKENWFLHEYIEGENLKEFNQVSDTFFDELHHLISSLHQKGVVYVDTAKRDNIIVGIDQKPYLIDFQISLKFPQKYGGIFGIVFKLFVQSDFYHIHKHKRRIRRDLVGEIELQKWKNRSVPHTIHDYILVRPFRWFKRKFLPSYF